jgi:hypothetical protein
MSVKFIVGKVVKDTVGCRPTVSRLADRLASSLQNFNYHGSVGQTNSKQLNIDFDKPFFTVLETKGWHCERDPMVDMESLGEDWGSPKADAILTHESKKGQRIVLEIEKSNKKTLWFDFIKLLMFIESGHASAGVILCPLNYAHKLGVWNLFEEARRYKKYLLRFAGVAKEKLGLIVLLGYEQRIVSDDGKSKLWDAEESKRIKQESIGSKS